MYNPSNKAGALAGSVVLITGALTGIGREGAKVVISGRHEPQGLQLVNELEKLGTEALFIKADVRFDQEIKTVVDGTMVRFGRLDITVKY